MPLKVHLGSTPVDMSMCSNNWAAFELIEHDSLHFVFDVTGIPGCIATTCLGMEIIPTLKVDLHMHKSHGWASESRNLSRRQGGDNMLI